MLTGLIKTLLFASEMSFRDSIIFLIWSLLVSVSTNLSFIFLILVIIGGSFFSTSSGIRFLKIYSLFKYSINEILSYSRPKNIFVNKHLFSKENY